MGRRQILYGPLPGRMQYSRDLPGYEVRLAPGKHWSHGNDVCRGDGGI